MKLRIQSTPNCTQEQLRTLLIDAADELAGANSSLLESKLPWDGYPILLADTDGNPILVSFDSENSQAALLNGLHATEQLAVALPWVNRVYEVLQQRRKAPRLVVISYEPPPGAEAVLAGCPQLTLYTYKVLRINDDSGIWLERLGGKNKSVGQTDRHNAAPQAVIDEIRTRGRATPAANTIHLSDEERAYFRQL
jgi:hypothetical protein